MKQIQTVRTDLAIEFASSLTAGSEKQSLPEGMKVYSKKVNTIEITTIELLTDSLAQRMGKAKGKYITIETQPLWKSSLDLSQEICAVAQSLRGLLPSHGSVLVVGLGNSGITPDALGPLVVERIMATRHISGELAQKIGLDHLRKVSAIAPGVMGQTGIETGEIVAALVNFIRPAAVIAVDALAAQGLERLGRTIQIANTGISPGSGVLNARKELCEKTLGIPVISLGIPTVVDAATLAYGLLEEAESQQIAQAHFSAAAVATSTAAQMMVTPREIDLLVGHGSKFISLAINKALQPELSLEEINYLCA